MGNTVGRLQSMFPQYILNVLVGSLLGDGRLECRSKGIRHPKTARFRVHHGWKQEEYVNWKYERLQNITLSGPREIIRYNEKRRIKEKSFYFHTRSIDSLGILHTLFYRGGDKRLPKKELQKLLNSEVLAIWFMDDGCRSKKSFVLNTHNFSKQDEELIKMMLFERFGVETTSVKDRNQTKIRIKSSSSSRFKKIITPYLIPSMFYKIANPRND